MNYFTDRILDRWREMVQDNRNVHVFVDEQKLGTVASDWAKLSLEKDAPPPNWRTKGVEPENNIAFVSQLLYKSAIDFAFTLFDPPHDQYKVEEFSGSSAMGRCFYRYFGENPVPAETFLQMRNDWCEGDHRAATEFFQGDNLPSLLGERVLHLAEVAEVMERDFRDDIMRFVRFPFSDLCAVSSYETLQIGLVEVLLKIFPTAFGQDHHNHQLYFAKRPQLFVLMYHGRALDSGGELPLLRDPEHIGPVVDYQVPNCLRSLNVLCYSETLGKTINDCKMIARQSPEELEIRIATTYAVAELLERINKIRRAVVADCRPWTMLELDFKLWSEGREASKEIPHHLCITTDY